jgi:hypothetical protein
MGRNASVSRLYRIKPDIDPARSYVRFTSRVSQDLANLQLRSMAQGAIPSVTAKTLRTVSDKTFLEPEVP